MPLIRGAPLLCDLNGKPQPGSLASYRSSLGNSLVASWLFNEGSGAKVFSDVWLSDTAYYGDLINSPTWVPEGLQFTRASSQYIKAGVWPGHPEFTVAGSIKYADYTSKNSIIAAAAQGDGAMAWQLFQSNDYIQGYVWVGNTPYNGQARIPADGSFVSFAFRNNGVTANIVVNGCQGASWATGAVDTDQSSISIGSRVWSSWLNVDKYIDATYKYLYLFNRAITDSEAMALHIDPYFFMRPEMPDWMFYFETAGGLSIPVAMHHYRQQRRA